MLERGSSGYFLQIIEKFPVTASSLTLMLTVQVSAVRGGPSPSRLLVLGGGSSGQDRQMSLGISKWL